MNENEILDQGFEDDLFKPGNAFINGLKSTLIWAFILIIISFISQAWYFFEIFAKKVIDPSSNGMDIFKYQALVFIAINLSTVYFLWKFHKYGKAYLNSKDDINLQLALNGLNLFFMTTVLSWVVFYLVQYIFG